MSRYRPADLKPGDAFFLMAVTFYLWHKAGGSWWVFLLFGFIGGLINAFYRCRNPE
jgi:membrane protease YdiL (CAAX protease family)